MITREALQHSSVQFVLSLSLFVAEANRRLHARKMKSVEYEGESKVLDEESVLVDVDNVPAFPWEPVEVATDDDTNVEDDVPKISEEDFLATQSWTNWHPRDCPCC